MRKFIDGKLNGRIHAFNLISVAGTEKTNEKAVQDDPGLGESYYGMRFAEEANNLHLLETSFRKHALEKDGVYRSAKNK